MQWVGAMVASTGGRVSPEEALLMSKKMDPTSRAHGIIKQIMAMNFMLMLEKNPASREQMIKAMAADTAAIVRELDPDMRKVVEKMVPKPGTPAPDLTPEETRTIGQRLSDWWYGKSPGGPVAGTPFDVDAFLDDIEMDEGIPLPGQ